MFAKAVLWIVCGYIIWVGLLFAFQRRVVFPRHMVGPAPGAGGLERKPEVWIVDPGFGPVEAFFLPSPFRKKAPLVIFAHGNAERMEQCLAEMDSLIPPDFGVLLVEYPGYGDSAGSPGKKSIARTFEAAYDAAVKRPEVDPDNIIGFGRSLGGAAVCQLAETRPLSALVLMSAFTRMVDLTRRYLVPDFFVLDRFDNLAAVENFKGPVLVVHGKQDEIIPFAHGQLLAKAAEKGDFLPLECGHNDCPPDHNSFAVHLANFLFSAISPSPD